MSPGVGPHGPIFRQNDDELLGIRRIPGSSCLGPGATSAVGWGPEATIFVCPGNPAWKKEGTVPYTLGTCGTSLARARCLQKEKARTMTGFGIGDKRTA